MNPAAGMTAILAEDINREHALACECAQSAIQHAIRCGEMLQAKKAELPHGQFMGWVAANCEFKYSTAARYMKAAAQSSMGIEQTLRHVPATIRFLSLEPLIAPAGPMDLTGIHWVILGGESGPGARPMQADWARDVRDQCLAQRVPFFFKQWGKASNNPLFSVAPHGITASTWAERHDPGGKGGSLLDGVTWKEYPRP